MQKISDGVRSSFNETVLGRLKLKLLESISGDAEVMPSSQTIRHFIAEQYRSNASVGRLYLKIITQKSTNSIDYHQLPEPRDLHRLLRLLDENPLHKSFFFEIWNCPSELSPSLGVLVYCEPLAVGGYVYIVTLFDDRAFPDHFVGRAEVRSSQIEPEPAFSILEDGGYTTLSWHNIKTDSFGAFLVRILNYVYDNRPRHLIPMSELEKFDLLEIERLNPPEDKRLMELLRSVHEGDTECAEAKAQLSLIKPHSLDFCLSFPQEVIDDTVKRIEDGKSSRLLVYWYEGTLVMSDDYSYYLAYRKMDYSEVPIVVIGPFPKNLIQCTRVGGPELIPPLGITQDTDTSLLSPALKEFELERRLHEDNASPEISSLFALFMLLAELIQDSRTKERELHEFLLKHPVAIDTYGIRVQTEVRLGASYRIDLVIEYGLADRRLTLIELENARASIFTSKGRPRAKVTHATQQVEDWLRWLRENPKRLPFPLDGSAPADGLVVIGQSVDFDDDTKRRLLSLNHDRKVKVITYDDLLDRLMSLIRLLENKES